MKARDSHDAPAAEPLTVQIFRALLENAAYEQGRPA